MFSHLGIPSNLTTLSFGGGGSMRDRQNWSICTLPFKAASIAVLLKACSSSLIKFIAVIVTRFREPSGLPLPHVFPGLNLALFDEDRELCPCRYLFHLPVIRLLSTGCPQLHKHRGGLSDFLYIGCIVLTVIIIDFIKNEFTSIGYSII